VRKGLKKMSDVICEQTLSWKVKVHMNYSLYLKDNNSKDYTKKHLKQTCYEAMKKLFFFAKVELGDD